MKTMKVKRVLSIALILAMVMTLQPVWGQRTLKTQPVLKGTIIINAEEAVVGEKISVFLAGEAYDIPDEDIFYDWYMADKNGNILDHTQCQEDNYTPMKSDAGFYLVVTASAKGYSGELKSDPVIVKKKLEGKVEIANNKVYSGETVRIRTTGTVSDIPQSALKYNWMVTQASGPATWEDVGTKSSYVPSLSQEGMFLRVSVTADGYKGMLTSEMVTILPGAGTIEFNPDKATVGSRTTVELKGSYAQLDDSSIIWEISRDNGKTWNSLNCTGKSYTPVPEDKGALISVKLNKGGSAGIVRSKSLKVKDTLKLKVVLDYSEAVQGNPLHAELIYSPEDIAEGTTFNYSWYYLADGMSHWALTRDYTGDTIIPGEELENCNIKVKVTSPDYNGEVYSTSSRIYGRSNAILGTATLNAEGTGTGDVINVKLSGKAAGIAESSLRYTWEARKKGSDSWSRVGENASSLLITEELAESEIRVKVRADGLKGYLMSNVMRTVPAGEPREISSVGLDSRFTKTDDVTYKYTADGKQVSAEPEVKDQNGNKLEEGKDYSVKYDRENRTEPGRYTITVEGINGCTGGETLILVITPEAPSKVRARLSKAKGGYDDAYIYWTASEGATGYCVYARRPSKTSKWTSLGRTTETDFLEKNLSDGYTYEFKVIPYITFDDMRYKSGEYRTAKLITLKKVSTPSVKKYSSSKVRVRWKNIGGETGYQISRSTSRKGTNIVSTYKTAKGTSKVVKAKRNRGYYYKVRAYRMVGDRKVYAPWSNVKYYKFR